MRFPEFVEEWKKTKIGNIALKVGSGVTPKGGEAVYTAEGHPFVRSQNVGKGCLLLEDIAYIDEPTHCRQKSTELQLNDVLLNITGASIGRSAVVDSRISGGNVNQHVCIIRLTDEANPFYLCNYLLSNLGQKQIDSFQCGGNRQGLNFEQIKSMALMLPTKREQDKIATLLNLINERIATQNKIIDNLQSLIKGLNDDFHDTVVGESVSFSDIGLSYSGLSGKSGNDFGCGQPYITYLNVYLNNIVNESQVDYVKVNNGETQNMVCYGDVLFSLSSETPEEVGIGSVYLGESNKYYLNSFCFGVHITAIDKIYPPYMAYLVSSKVFRRFVYPLAQGSTRFNLQKNDFMKKTFKLPSLQLQVKHANILNALTNKLSIESAIRNKYMTQKKHLLSRMFI